MFSNLVTLCLYGTNHLPIFVNNLVGTIAVNFLDNILNGCCVASAKSPTLEGYGQALLLNALEV